MRAVAEAAIAEHNPDVVLDLSDEPVLGPPARFRLAARVLACGVPYEGADFRLDPPRFDAIGTPSLAYGSSSWALILATEQGHSVTRSPARAAATPVL